MNPKNPKQQGEILIMDDIKWEDPFQRNLLEEKKQDNNVDNTPAYQANSNKSKNSYASQFAGALRRKSNRISTRQNQQFSFSDQYFQNGSQINRPVQPDKQIHLNSLRTKYHRHQGK